jgi:protein SCO1
MTTKRAIVAGAMCIVAALTPAAMLAGAEAHTVQGIVLEVDQAKRSIVVSCEAIPGYMDAMAMPFKVLDAAALKAVVPGATVRFQMVEQGSEEIADQLKVVKVTNYESEPTQAGRLTYLHRAMDPTAAAKIVAVGQAVPDFALMDQGQHLTRLSQFKGKVVALTFAYSRCPNPTYCFRLSNNLARLSKRFHDAAGHDLVLMTIVIDPEDDQGKALERYAETWKADPATWHFLTGKVSEIRSVAEMFGMNFWSDEGFLTHSFHTVVIDRKGKLAANLEGNQFSAEQLGDLVGTVLRPGEKADDRPLTSPNREGNAELGKPAPPHS